MFNNLVIEYDRRLEQQVTLAKEDMLHELEIQIQVRIVLCPSPSTINRSVLCSFEFSFS